MEKILLSVSQIADKNQREVVIPEGYTKIGDGAFRYCEALVSVVIPDTVTEIGEGAFRGCTALASVVIPDSVTKIAARAFRDCTSLESVSVPCSARWSDDTFANCPNVKIIRR